MKQVGPRLKDIFVDVVDDAVEIEARERADERVLKTRGDGEVRVD